MKSKYTELTDNIRALSKIASLPKWNTLNDNQKQWLTENSSNTVTIKTNADTKKEIVKKIISEYITTTDEKQKYFMNISMQIMAEKSKCKDLSQIAQWTGFFNTAVKVLNAFSELENHQDRIKKMLCDEKIVDIEQIELIVNPNKGANDSYIAQGIDDKLPKFYIKTFSQDARLDAHGKIDPCEALVYKIMEYAGFAPKTYFLVSSGSSSAGDKSMYAGNYIVTQALGNETEAFALDSSLNIEWFNKISETKHFAVEMQSSAGIRDILSVWDTFNVNTENYGVLFADIQDDINNFKIQFIDHLPNANNGILTNISDTQSEEQYSPRARLESEFSAITQQNKTQSPLVKLGIHTKHLFTKDLLKDSLICKLFKKSDDHANLRKAVELAHQDVKNMISEHGLNFVEKANDKLNSYVDKIVLNIKTFCSKMDINLEDVDFLLHQENDFTDDLTPDHNIGLAGDINMHAYDTSLDVG